jgi:enoyl-CoA hydratase/carnithine racemase
MSDIEVEIDGGMAVLTIDRPETRNAIALGTIDRFHEVLDEAEAANARVVVLRGAGDRAFVSGGDLNELAKIRDEEGAAQMATRMRRLLDRLSRFRVPVIAAINGAALGGGAEVAVAADIRIAADDAKIGFTQARLAIMPAWGGAERLAELVGRSRALLLIGTGRVLTADEAERIGLVDQVAPRQRFDEAWRETAEAFAALPPGAAAAIKEVVAAARPNDHPALETAAVRRFAELWVRDEHWQAVEQGSKRP